MQSDSTFTKKLENAQFLLNGSTNSSNMYRGYVIKVSRKIQAIIRRDHASQS